MDPTKRCPLCGEVILAIASRCRYCQGDLSQPVPLLPAAESADADEDAPRRVPRPETPPIAIYRMPPPSPPSPPRTPEEFEQRFLEFAYNTDILINAPSVAYALKMPIDEAAERLEDLAARDVLIREVDARGSVFFHLPGRQQVRMAQAAAAQPGYGRQNQALVPVHIPSPAVVLHPPGTALAQSHYGPGELAEAGPPPSEGTALAALLVNTLCLPGLGSIIGGRSSAGIGQLLLFLIGMPLCFMAVVAGAAIGAPMILSAWIWALITGIDVMNQAKQAQAQAQAQQRRLGP